MGEQQISEQKGSGMRLRVCSLSGREFDTSGGKASCLTFFDASCTYAPRIRSRTSVTATTIIWSDICFVKKSSTSTGSAEQKLRPPAILS
jgi:hypothetical protein